MGSMFDSNVSDDLMEQAILAAAENDDDNLDSLLQEACEMMDEERANLLLDKVHQIVKEGLQDALGWKEVGILKYGYEEWVRGLPPMPAPSDEN